jgi:hypothetical protein
MDGNARWRGGSNHGAQAERHCRKHYRRRLLDLLRMWHVKIEAWILEQAGIKQPEESASGLRLVKS